MNARTAGCSEAGTFPSREVVVLPDVVTRLIVVAELILRYERFDDYSRSLEATRRTRAHGRMCVCEMRAITIVSPRQSTHESVLIALIAFELHAVSEPGAGLVCMYRSFSPTDLPNAICVDRILINF